MPQASGQASGCFAKLNTGVCMHKPAPQPACPPVDNRKRLFVPAAVASGAKLAALSVFDKTGGATYATLLQGIEWAVANKEKYDVSVINMSLGGPAPGDQGEFCAQRTPNIVTKCHSNLVSGLPALMGCHMHNLEDDLFHSIATRLIRQVAPFWAKFDRTS